jgi:hypothetical protein
MVMIAFSTGWGTRVGGVSLNRARANHADLSRAGLGMEQEAAGWRKSVAIARCWMRKPADQAPREIAPLGSYDRAVQIRMLERDLARASSSNSSLARSARPERRTRVTDE